ncbi:uncharacterized protein DNG_07996 [Cephalotrichum gorgonifer]|uniref:Uncharacterized protein n=1 Tax=Cephalotrichum gorgonifer TaxID=2041049 RepID=A0AAE8SXZ6_9PEZI|nr:uncharacterized protein DNG_07996 [Cephalotrichum gorgonifer]
MAPTDFDNKAADIITYVGVPLAVLGLVPILYNFLATLITLYKVKRKLRLNHVATTTTRSDIVNRVIEVEFPRYAVTPKRCIAPASRKLSARQSRIDGGSWTIFEWEKQEVGGKIQRIQYPTQIRQPQVEVDFAELVAYLHSLGAIPDEQGWKRLRSSGLWMPKGLSLMNSPDGSQKALVIASLDDSDGNLSLAATPNWSPNWIPKGSSFQPPNVVRLVPRTAGGPVITAGEVIVASECSQETADSKSPEELRKKKPDSREVPLDSPQKKSDGDDSKAAIVCEISTGGLSNAHWQASNSPTSTASHHVLDIEHLRTRDESLDGSWFASAATAYRTTSKTILWGYTIPDEILSFAKRATVPCGVLVLLGIADDSETPDWATRYDAQDAEGEHFFDRIAERRLAARAEASMSPNQRRAAAMHEQVRLEDQSRATRTHEALQSPRWDATRVAEHALRWLKPHDHRGRPVSLEDTAGSILHSMVLDREFSSSICAMLDLWKAWVDKEGMKGSDLAYLQEAPEVFAQASLLVTLVKDSVTGSQQMLVDLQACVRTWKTVRLG